MLHPDSGFFLIFQVNTRKNTKRVETYPLEISLLLEEKGKAKRSPSMTEKLQHAFRRLVLPDARRFWLLSPDTAASKGYVTRILLAVVFEG
jgi:hypothetical protein